VSVAQDLGRRNIRDKKLSRTRVARLSTLSHTPLLKGIAMKAMMSSMLMIASTVMFPPQAVFAAPSQDESKIHQLLDDWAKAFHARDLAAIMSMYAPGVVAYDIVPPLQYVGSDAYKKDYQTFLYQFDGPIDVEYRDVHITAGSDVAFATGLEHMRGKMKDGNPLDMWLRFTSGFQKIKGQWKDVHDHVSVPVDFDSGKALLDLKP
jgi:ketosteroid isomerase-like protein